MSAPSSSLLPRYARTAGRGVRLQIRPRPRTIQHRRHILAYLRSYGPVVLFQSLKYDPLPSSSSSYSSSTSSSTSAAPHAPSENIALALYQSEGEAERLLEASPLNLELGDEGARAVARDSADDDGDRNRGSSLGTDSAVAAAAAVYTIWVERSGPDFHARQLRQAYAGPFAFESNTAMVEDLRRRVPVPALADCRVDKGVVPLRVRRMEKPKGGAARWEKGFSLWEMWKGQGERVGQAG